MVGLVETMLKLHKDLPKAKTPHEQESLQRQISATDTQIDQFVYDSCGPTANEVGINGGDQHDKPSNASGTAGSPGSSKRQGHQR
jgi:hypothetical protein